MRRSLRLPTCLLLLLFALAPECGGPKQVAFTLDGLEQPVRVRIDGNGVPHVFAANDTDMARVQGWLHARDRFWKMDITRREVDGTLGELFGASRLGDDIQMRAFGLHRAAGRSRGSSARCSTPTPTASTSGWPRSRTARGRCRRSTSTSSSRPRACARGPRSTR